MLVAVSIEIRLLGTLEVSTPAGLLATADFQTRKAKQVLEVLALMQGRAVSKDALIDTLWQRKWPKNPTATVELAVSLLRSTLAKVTDARIVVTEPGGYRVDTSLVTIDVVTFQDLVVDAGRRSETERLGLLRQALALARGPLLEDEVGAEWLQPYRDRYRLLVESARLGLARSALAAGDASLAHSAAEQAWTEAEFVHEDAYVVGVSALVELGRRTEARVLLARVERRLVDEEGRPPSSGLLGLHDLLHDTTIPTAPDTAIAVDPAFVGAPAVLPFLGRAEQLESIERFVAQHLDVPGSRGSLTISGPAGIGKSRLLAEVAQRAAVDRSVHSIRCMPSDPGHQLLVVGQLMRSIARTARLRKQLVLDQDVTAMFGRFAQMLDVVGPTLVLVDDMHLADAGSVAVLQALVGAGGATNLCLVGTHPTSRGGLVGGEKIVLSALSQAELQPLGIEAAWSETGGHPGLLAACCAAGAHVLAGVPAQMGDDDLREVRSWLDRPGRLARSVLSSASVLAGSFMVADVVLASGMGAETVAAVLSQATQDGVLRKSEADRVEFSAQLLRRVLNK